MKKGILRVGQNGYTMFYCPGCKEFHAVNLGPGGWGFNGDYDKPTFTPSVLVTMHGNSSYRCHSFVTDGKIQFLSDCSHELAGQTIALEDQKD